MLFQYTWKQVLDGSKTQLRRPVQEGDVAVFDDNGSNIIKVTHTAQYGPPKVLFEVGQSYSIQPGVAKKTMGKIKVTAIRREQLQEVSEADALREFPLDMAEAEPSASTAALSHFQATWDSISAKPGQSWADNPAVWVVTFELLFK
jgi:hypothetical protein